MLLMLIMTIILGGLALAEAIWLVKVRRDKAATAQHLAAAEKERQTEHDRAETIKQEAETTLKASDQRVEQQVETHRRRFELAGRAMYDVLYVLDIATGTIEWNQNLSQLYGYETTEPAGTIEWWTAHIHPDDALAVNDMIEKLAIPAATNWTIDYRFRQADGKYRSVRDRAFILRDKAGQAVELIGVIRLRTEEKEEKI